MVCFSEGSIWGLVKALPTHWHLWSAPIGRYRPGILPLTGMMSLRSGCMVRTICGQLVTSCLHLGRFFLLPPHPHTPPSPPLPSPPLPSPPLPSPPLPSPPLPSPPLPSPPLPSPPLPSPPLPSPPPSHPPPRNTGLKLMHTFEKIV